MHSSTYQVDVKTTVTKTAVAHHVSQKTTVTPHVTKDDGHTTCHKRRRNTPRVTKTTVHTTCHKDNGYTPMSRRTMATNRMLPRTVVTNHMSQNAAKNHMSTTVVKPYVTKDAAKPICQRLWLQTICQTHVKFGAITPNGAKCKLLLNTCTIFYYITVNSYIS